MREAVDRGLEEYVLQLCHSFHMGKRGYSDLTKFSCNAAIISNVNLWITQRITAERGGFRLLDEPCQ